MRPSLFHEPWWLDAVAPGAWREVAAERGGKVVGRLPFVERRRWGVRMLLAPPLTNRLGPLVDPGEGRYTKQLGREAEIVHELLDALPRHDLFRQNLRPDVLSWYPLHRAGAIVEPRLSYVVALDDLDRAWQDITIRRTIRGAEREVVVEVDQDATRLLPMATATFRRQGKELPYDPELLERVVAAAIERDRGTVLTAVGHDGAVHSSILVVWEEGRAYYLVGGSDPELRNSGANSLLFWDAMQRCALRVPAFDFEGSMVPGIERAFRAFGGQQETYHSVTSVRRALPAALLGARSAVQRRREGSA